MVRRFWSLLLSPLLAFGILGGPMTVPAAAAGASTVTLTVSPARPIHAENFTIEGTLPTALSRPVVLQKKVGSFWKEMATGATDSAGVFSLTGATRKSSLTVRVVAPATTVGAAVLTRVVTRTLRIHAVGQKATLSIPSRAVVGWSVDVAVKFTPARTGRPVALQQRTAGKWVTIATSTELGNGRAALSFTPATAGKLAFRAYAPAWHGAAAVHSTARTVKVAAGVAKQPAAAVSAGDFGACAVTKAGGVECWGLSAFGELGNGVMSNDLEAVVKVKGLSKGVTAVASGHDSSCALTKAGAVKCWGRNTWGKLGDGTTKNRSTPVQVKGLTSGVVAITVGQQDACALTASGGVKCWGGLGGWLTEDLDHPDFHYFGRTPVDVPGLTSGVVAIDAGYFHNCALTVDKLVKCWGYNWDGQVGVAPAAHGVDRYVASPVTVAGVTDAVSVSAGLSHSCAVTSANVVRCWGANEGGELGDGTKTTSWTPVTVAGLSGQVAGVSAGFGATCALSEGVVTCWGESLYGIGNGANGSVAPLVPMGLPGNVVAVSTGGRRSYAVTGSGQVFGWGGSATAVPSFG